MARVQPQDLLLTPEEVAAVARVELRTVGAWRRAGRLPGVPLPAGRLWRYRLRDVAAAFQLDPADLVTEVAK